jgi:ElaA protein
MAAVTWRLVPFDQLKLAELYRLLQLRQEVFVVEQACAFLDADGIDLRCDHVLAEVDGEIVATARIVPPGVVHEHASIGRVVSAASVRRSGLGRPLMQTAIRATLDSFGQVPIYLGAQAYLQRFYEGLGFEVSGEGYDEDGIPHLPMVRPATGGPRSEAV